MAKWNALFGLPSVNFHCIIHGLSGHGKSTFAIRFAKYFAGNSGRVLYVSGEEAFSMTSRDKFVNKDACSIQLKWPTLGAMMDLCRKLNPTHITSSSLTV